MSMILLSEADAPKYAGYVEVWKYSELKNYFAKLSCNFEALSATKMFLSNIEGLGDYFDEHSFFDFQAYLILNIFWLESKRKVLEKRSDEYRSFCSNLKTFMSGHCDKWAYSKKELDLMKADCRKIQKYYINEE